MIEKKYYETELHRLKYLYKSAFNHRVLFVSLLILIPDNFSISIYGFILGKHLLILPAIAGEVYIFHKLAADLVNIFVYPTN